MAHKLDIPNDWWEMLNYLYDGCIKYVDHCVGEIFDFLKENLEDFCLIVTSDHGELLGEYDLLDHHSVLHDAVTHIPLVAHGLPIPEDRNLVQHSDLMKTILSAVGISRSHINGVDLRTQKRRTAYTQTLHESVHDDNRKDYDLIKRFKTEYENTYLPNSLITSARTKKFKLVRTDTKENLYTLDDETVCVKSDYPKVYNHLLEKLDSFSDDLPRLDQHESYSEELNSETKKRLIDMGYL
jgi:Arylsulfatase A and related enzymes